MYYTDTENKEKALTVRSLLKQGKKNEAELLSKDLGEYLKQKYPLNFKTYSYWLSPKDWEKINNRIAKENSIDEILLEITKYDEIKLNNFVFLHENKEKEFRTLIVFLDEAGFHSSPSYNYGYDIFPDQFYLFCEQLGLMPSTATSLYKFGPIYRNYFIDGWVNFGASKYKL